MCLTLLVSTSPLCFYFPLPVASCSFSLFPVLLQFLWVLPHPPPFPLVQVEGRRAQPRVTGVLLLALSLNTSFTLSSSFATIILKDLSNFTLNHQQPCYQGHTQSCLCSTSYKWKKPWSFLDYNDTNTQSSQVFAGSHIRPLMSKTKSVIVLEVKGKIWD